VLGVQHAHFTVFNCPTVVVIARGVDPNGTGGTCPPNIYEGPPNIL